MSEVGQWTGELGGNCEIATAGVMPENLVAGLGANGVNASIAPQEPAQLAAANFKPGALKPFL